MSAWQNDYLQVLKSVLFSDFSFLSAICNLQGTGCEMYTETLSPSFTGMTFALAAEWVNALVTKLLINNLHHKIPACQLIYLHSRPLKRPYMLFLIILAISACRENGHSDSENESFAYCIPLVKITHQHNKIASVLSHWKFWLTIFDQSCKEVSQLNSTETIQSKAQTLKPWQTSVKFYYSSSTQCLFWSLAIQVVFREAEAAAAGGGGEERGRGLTDLNKSEGFQTAA